MTQQLDRSNLDDASAHYGLDHSPSAVLPIATGGDRSLRGDPELAGKNPDELAQILAEREAHKNGCNDPKCGRCNNVDDRLLRGTHPTTGGGSGSGRRRDRTTNRPDHSKQNIHDFERGDLRPRNVAGRVSNEAYSGLNAAGNPSIGEMMDAVGLALYHGASWAKIATLLASL